MATISAVPLTHESKGFTSLLSDSPPAGQTRKIGDHLYETQVGVDGQMATSGEILQALNTYRGDHGSSPLSLDAKLCAFAQNRAQQQDSQGGLDSHQGFNAYMAEKNHWTELNVHGIGENSAWGYRLSATHFIEWVFAADSEHNNNQLNPSWTLACAAVAGKTVDIIFGRR